MKSKTTGHVKDKARLAAAVLMLVGGSLGLSSLHAQSLNGSATAADPKAVASPSTTPPAADHINLWNEDGAQNQSWMVHFQNTDVVQGNPPFHSPYENEESNSLPASTNIRETISIDLYLGAHLWPGGELYFDIQPYQGFGLGNTTGLAAFPNG